MKRHADKEVYQTRSVSRSSSFRLPHIQVVQEEKQSWAATPSSQDWMRFPRIVSL